MPISQMLLPEFDMEMANTRKLLEKVPENWSYKPHEKSMTLGRLAGHVAEIPKWGKVTLDMDLLEMEPGMKPYEAASRAEMLEAFDANVAGTRAAIAAAGDEEYQKIWRMKFGGKEMFAMPKIMVIRSMVLNHLIHHRAQLGVYLRMNGAEVPGMYGPSADEPKWWVAGEV